MPIMLGEHVAMQELNYRQLHPSDHATIIQSLPHWWAGRDLTSMLPKVFALHFHKTSLAVENDGRLVGFLIGFMSPSYLDEAYIHFVGVAPDIRERGVARELYRRFFELARLNGRRIIRCCTSPGNRLSVEFHRAMGFTVEPGNGEIEGLSVSLDYNKPGDHKVLFAITIK